MPREFRYDCPGHQYLSHDQPCPQCDVIDPGPQLPAKPPRTKKHYVTCEECGSNFRLDVGAPVPAHRWKRSVKYPNGETCPGSPAPPEPTPLQVYVLTGESNGSENGESDGWVIGVYGTREGANAAHAAAVQEAIAAGHRVIGYESPADEDDDEWDRSFLITSYEVKA